MSEKTKTKPLSSAWGFFYGLFLVSLLMLTVGTLMHKGGYTISKKKATPDTETESPTTPIVVEPTTKPTEEPTPKAHPAIKPLTPIQASPTQPYGEKVTDMRTLSKEFDYTSSVDFQAGDITSKERTQSESYHAYYNLTIHEPKPALLLEDVTHASPELGEQLPSLPLLLETATVNPYWSKLYRLKKKRTVDNAHHLLKLLTKHNYYDCQTILNLKHPETSRRAVLLQGDMDVVADGSDGDRLPTMPEDIVTSTHYQPTTSYSWEKQTKIPNPMVAGYKERIKNADAELAKPGTASDRKDWLKGRKKMLQQGIQEMEKRSYLIAEYDPFIVLPVPVIVAKDDYSPNVGDYAIVFHGDKMYPAIVGDAGPEYKVGEASLRMAQTINPKANPYYRAVSDVSVSYLVFPGTRKKPFGPPNYEDIRQECLRLAEEIGGLGDPEKLHKWEDLFPKPEQPEVILPDADLPPEISPE